MTSFFQSVLFILVAQPFLGSKAAVLSGPALNSLNALLDTAVGDLGQAIPVGKTSSVSIKSTKSLIGDDSIEIAKQSAWKPSGIVNLNALTALIGTGTDGLDEVLGGKGASLTVNSPNTLLGLGVGDVSVDIAKSAALSVPAVNLKSLEALVSTTIDDLDQDVQV